MRLKRTAFHWGGTNHSLGIPVLGMWRLTNLYQVRVVLYQCSFRLKSRCILLFGRCSIKSDLFNDYNESTSMFVLCKHPLQKRISAKRLCIVILTVILSSEYFRSDVIGGTTKSACRIARSQALLQKTWPSSAWIHLRGVHVQLWYHKITRCVNNNNNTIKK